MRPQACWTSKNIYFAFLTKILPNAVPGKDREYFNWQFHSVAYFMFFILSLCEEEEEENDDDNDDEEEEEEKSFVCLFFSFKLYQSSTSPTFWRSRAINIT